MLTKTKIFSSTFIHPYRGWEDNFIFKRKVFSWNSISRLLKAIFSFPAVLIITTSNGDTWGDQNQKKQEQFTLKVPLPKRNGLHNSTKPPEPSIVLSTHPSSTELSQLNKAVTMTRPWATSDPCIWVVTEIVSRTTASLLQSSSLWNSVKKPSPKNTSPRVSHYELGTEVTHEQCSQELGTGTAWYVAEPVLQRAKSVNNFWVKQMEIRHWLVTSASDCHFSS